MCLFITAVVPHVARTNRFEDVLVRHHTRFGVLANPHAKAFLAPGEVQGTITRGHCDCGSSLVGPGKRSDDALANAVAKLRRKGWGEAKIRDWIATTAPRPGTSIGMSPVEWANLIDDLLELDAHDRGRVGLVLHWYRGHLETEDLGALRRVRCSTMELRSPSFGGLAFDGVHEFGRHAA